jgi:hypothetical protein
MDALDIILLMLLLCLLSFLGGIWTAVSMHHATGRGSAERAELKALRSALRLTTDAWYARQQLHEAAEEERREGGD